MKSMTSRVLLAFAAPVTLIALLVGGVSGQAVRVGKQAPEITGGPWLGSEPLTLASLRGRVVLLEFWTFG